jgi:Arc/MetJ-type ribon-helix-helix transcriptional regulator
MTRTEVDLSDRLASQIDRLVEQGEFLNRDQAVEELLTMGVSAYETTTDEPGQVDDDLFTQAIDDQQDPAAMDDDGLGY